MSKKVIIKDSQSVKFADFLNRVFKAVRTQDAKYEVETEKGTLLLNGTTATALASDLLRKLNNPRARSYKLQGGYGDEMFSVILIDKEKKPFKQYFLKKG